MKGRGRFIGGGFVGSEATERKAGDDFVAARHDSGECGVLNGDDDKSETQKKSQTTVLSANAKELLAGREVTVNDIHDDVSSINDSIYMQAFGNEDSGGGSPKRPTNARSLLAGGLLYSAEEGSSADKPIKLLGPQDDDTDSLESGRSQSTAELKGKLNKLTSKYQMVDLDATVGLPSSSHDVPNQKSGEKTGHRRRAPRWLYCAIVVIILSVIGAGVAIFRALSSKSSNEDSNIFSTSTSSSENKDSPNTQSVFTRSSPAPAPAPVRAPTPPPVNPPTLESIYTLLTSAPTASSGAEVIAVTEVPTEPPTESPTASPTTASPTTTSPTRAPALEPSAFPTVIASDSPTVEPTTAVPTSSPTIDITTRAVLYFTAGRIEVPHSLPQFPTRKGTSFLVHLGDWNNPDERCKEESFQETSDIFANSTIPVYFVLGDAGE